MLVSSDANSFPIGIVLIWGGSGKGCGSFKQDFFPCLLFFFEEIIQQRDRNCEGEKAFIRSKVCVEEYTGKLAE